MATCPEFQEKAQAEIDRVVGQERLPDYNDRESLPYIEAMYREILRWRPPGPLGVPHYAASDDVYHGYFIPKGWFLIAIHFLIGSADKSFLQGQPSLRTFGKCPDIC